MKGKYADFYWSVKKHPEGFVWTIKNINDKRSEPIETSLDEEDIDERYFDDPDKAIEAVKERIREIYQY